MAFNASGRDARGPSEEWAQILVVDLDEKSKREVGTGGFSYANFSCRNKAKS
jgi:hypothetical protein